MQYGMVIDAGSSHSEVFLYAWKLPLSDEMGVVYQNSYCKPEGTTFNYKVLRTLTTFFNTINYST